MITPQNKNYLFDIEWDDNDHIGRMLQNMPKAERRMDGGKYMSHADANLLIFLHKLGLRGVSRCT